MFAFRETSKKVSNLFLLYVAKLVTPKKARNAKRRQENQLPVLTNKTLGQKGKIM